METKEQILKDFKHRVRNACLVVIAGAALSLGGIAYETNMHRSIHEELDIKKRNVLVRQYLDTNNNVLPYLRAELKKFYNSQLDSSLVSDNLRKKLGEVDERDLDRKRNLEEALQIAQNDSSRLSQAEEIKSYYSQIESHNEFNIISSYGALLNMLLFGALGTFSIGKAVNKKRKALKQIGEQ